MPDPYSDGSSQSNDGRQFNEFDSRQWSAMSYIDPDDNQAKYFSSYTVKNTNWVTTSGYIAAPETPMMDDILASQQLYGASTSKTLAGGQVFGFNCNISDAARAFFDFNVNVNPVITLYDTGTGNTLDCSGFKTNCTINLNPGTFSTANSGSMTNNIGIAYGTSIDTAIGGSGNDSFTVNGENDTIDGRSGTNRVIFSGNRSGYTISQNGATTTVVNKASNVTDTLTNISSLAFDDQSVPVCFASGTNIRVLQRGEFKDVAVETLVVGALVVAASGDLRPIRWLGHRTMDCRNHSRPHEVLPVRVRAHAFGENHPARDLLVSPGHSLCIDVVGEVLIPASALVNGTTITQENVDRVTYWHVELEGGHDILLAENMPCESYLDMGNRAFFAENGVVDLDASPDAPLPTHADFCRPFYATGALVEVVRSQLRVRAEQQGWHLEVPDLATCRLVVDGVAVAPKARGLSLLFTVPAGASVVWLESATSVPALLADSADDRTLGLSLSEIVISDGFRSLHVSPDDPRLCVGFHGCEREGSHVWRWTAGRARLPAALWEGVDEECLLRVDLRYPQLPRWVGPAQIEHERDVRQPMAMLADRRRA